MDSPTPKTTKWVFPPPLTIPPSSTHKQTIIILHGRGSTAAKFSTPLLTTTTRTGATLQTAFPNAKLIFPTAALNRAIIFNRSNTHQWFDHWHMVPVSERTKRQHWMRDGLHQSCVYIQGIMRAEVEAVGAENVVLWGLSQGAATVLMTVLSWDGGPLAAVVAMCGYLPFADHVEEIVEGSGEMEDDVFGVEGERKDLPTQAVEFLRGEIEMDGEASMVFQKIPIFLGHGTEDDKVDIRLGREAKRCLDLVGAEVRLVDYEGLGHWYSEDMLEDVFAFLREKLDKSVKT